MSSKKHTVEEAELQAYKEQAELKKRAAEALSQELDAVKRELAAANEELNRLRREVDDSRVREAAVTNATPDSVKALSAALATARAHEDSLMAEIRVLQDTASGLDILKEDRKSLVEQVNDLTRQEAALQEENSRLREDLKAARAEATSMQESVDKVQAKMKGVQEVAQSTRSLSALNGDRDFRRRFPQLPENELLVDWFTVNSMQSPGYLYIGTGHVCWEALAKVLTLGLTASKIVIPIMKITAVNKCHVAKVLPIQGMLFEIWAETGDNGKEVRHGFRAVKWPEIIKNILRQATLLGHPIRSLTDGKESDAP